MCPPTPEARCCKSGLSLSGTCSIIRSVRLVFCQCIANRYITHDALCSEDAVPLRYLPFIVQLAARRLQDKTSQVRKYAVGLLSALLKHNPFWSQLSLTSFTAELQKLGMEFKVTQFLIQFEPCFAVLCTLRGGRISRCVSTHSLWWRTHTLLGGYGGAPAASQGRSVRASTASESQGEGA